MKRILFIIGNMEIGGTRTSLLNLLYHLSSVNDLKISLLIMGHHGELAIRIPTNIEVLPEMFLISSALPRKQPREVSANIYHAFFHAAKEIVGYKKIFDALFRHMARKIQSVYGTYDAVFGYQEGLCNNFASYIFAKKRFAWIHNDVEKWYVPSLFSTEAYEKVDQIIFVAESAKEKFVDMFPGFSHKCVVIKNTIVEQMICEKYQACAPLDKSKHSHFVFTSVGRFTEQKAFDRIIPIAEFLKRQGVSFCWNVVGDGPLFSEIQKNIIDNGMCDFISLVGAVENPYGYIGNSDLLVVTSLYESQPMVILEALTLNVPVLTTRFSSAEEIIGEEKYGVIVNNNTEDIAQTLLRICQEESCLKKMKQAARGYQYDNMSIIRKIQEII